MGGKAGWRPIPSNSRGLEFALPDSSVPPCPPSSLLALPGRAGKGWRCRASCALCIPGAMYHVMIPREGERPGELRPLRQWGLRGTLALDVGFETVLSVGFGTSGRQALGAVPSADGKRRMAGLEGGEK